MTSRIKHIGIMSQTPPRLFKFYECLFDFRTDVRTPEQERERAKQIGYRILNSGRIACGGARAGKASGGPRKPPRGQYTVNTLFCPHTRLGGGAPGGPKVKKSVGGFK